MDCFANKNGFCSVLQNKTNAIRVNAENCFNCSFFKTHEQYVEDRLAYLDKEIDFLGLGETAARRLRAKLLETLKGGEPSAKEE